MPTARTTRRQLAELSYLLRAILDEVAAAGGPVTEAHRRALDLVDAFVAGDETARDALPDAGAAVTAANARYGVWSPPLQKALYWLPLVALAAMAQTGDDKRDLVVTHAGYAIPGLDWGGATARIDVLRAEAAARCAAIDDTPLPRRTRRPRARPPGPAR